jgi:hypothetical protein
MVQGEASHPQPSKARSRKVRYPPVRGPLALQNAIARVAFARTTVLDGQG